MIARSRIFRWTIGAVLPMMAACGRNDGARTDSAMASASDAMRGDSGAMGSMNGMMPPRGTDSMSSMPVMPSGTSMPGMSAAMTAHMAAMKGSDNAAMKAMLPDHQKMVSGMLSQMNEQMSNMKMTATSAWTALGDSIRNDLKQMPGMNATALAAMMPAHEMRITHLAAMHDDAMKGMK